MANFPKIYSTTASEEGHNIYTAPGSGLNPIWLNSDGVNSGAFGDFDESETGTASVSGSGVIDIYSFSEGAGAGQTAYALLILKNTGSAGSSFVFPSANSMNLSVDGVDSGLSAASTGFSIVNTIADATVNSIPRLISQADFTGAKDEGTKASATIDGKIFVEASNFGTTGEAITINFVDDESVGNACNITVSSLAVTCTVDAGTTQLNTIVTALNATGQAHSAFIGATCGLATGVTGTDTVTGSLIAAATTALACGTVTGLTTANGYAEPLGYFPIRDNTYSGGTLNANLSMEISSGYNTETHAGNANPDSLQFKYVPIYTVGQLNSNTVQNTASVPHYCAVLIKFEASAALSTSIDDQVFLNINVINADDMSIQLTGEVTSNASLNLQYGTAGSAIAGGGFNFANATNVISTTVAGNVTVDDVDSSLSIDTLDDMGRMRFYPLALAAGSANEPLEYIRISNNAPAASTLSYFPGDFAQLAGMSGTNGINQTNFHTSISSVNQSTISPHFVLQGSVTKLTIDTDNTDNTVVNGNTLWQFDVDMDDPSPNDQVQISIGDEHYLTLVRKSDVHELLPYHDFYHPESQVSATYATNVNDYAPIGHFNFRPFVLRHSYKWYPFYISAENNSGFNTTVAGIAFATYFPWTPSQEILARFRGSVLSTVSGPMYRNDTYRRAGLTGQNFGAALIPDDGSFETDNVAMTHKSIINTNNKTDLNNQQIIQPCAHDLDVMARDAHDSFAGQPFYDLMMEWNFNMLEPDPSVQFVGGSGSDNLYCSTFDWPAGEMKDGSGNLTGRFFKTGDEADSFSREQMYSSADGGGSNVLTSNNNRMAKANSASFTDITADQFPNGAEKRDVYFKYRFYPKNHFAYSYTQATHSQEKVDYLGRNIYSSQLFVTGGTDAVSFVSVDDADKEVILDTTRYPSLKFNALSWRHDPELYLVTSNENSQTVLSGSNINGHPTGCSVIAVDYNTANVTNNSWFKPDEAAKDETDYPNPTQTQTHGFTNLKMDLATGNDNLANGTAAIYESDFPTLQQYAFNGASVIRSTNAASASVDNVYEIKPRKNIIRHPSTNKYLPAYSQWDFFIQADTKLNSTYNRYEAYVPLNFAAKGDAGIRIIDITLAKHVGTHTAATNSWAYGALPANNSADAKKMAPCKAFKTHAEYNADISAAYSCADFVTQTSGADVADTSFIWNIVKNPTSSETYSESGSTVTNKAPYNFTHGWNGNAVDVATVNMVSTAWYWNAGSPNNPQSEQVKNTILGDFYGATLVSGALPRSSGGWADIFNDAGHLSPIVNEDGTTSTSVDYFNTLNGTGNPTPYLFFALDKTLADASGLTVAHFYNRIRVRYVREIKRDVVATDANNGIADQADGTATESVSIINASQLKIYEAYCLVKISFTGAQGILTVVDAEGDTVANDEHIDFGTINV